MENERTQLADIEVADLRLSHGLNCRGRRRCTWQGRTKGIKQAMKSTHLLLGHRWSSRCDNIAKARPPPPAKAIVWSLKAEGLKVACIQARSTKWRRMCKALSTESYAPTLSMKVGRGVRYRSTITVESHERSISVFIPSPHFPCTLCFLSIRLVILSLFVGCVQRTWSCIPCSLAGRP